MIPLETIIPNKHRIRVVLDSFHEWLRGLDFTMPDRMYDRKRNDGGMYLVSSEKIVSELMGMVDKRKYPGFLDVGCGKGFILWKAYQSGFKKIGGVEYDEKLTEICNKNMKRLKLTDYMTVTCTDAREFENYGDYDVFYFFNPFKGDIMQTVIDKICTQCAGREIMIMYYRPRYPEPIENTGFFTKIRTLYDEERHYDIAVYQGAIPAGYTVPEKKD